MNFLLRTWQSSFAPSAIPAGVRIMSALLGGEKNVNTLAGLVGITESAVSHHMRGLRQMHIVTARREGKEVYYRMDDAHIITLFRQGSEHIRG
jgi:DNA-binding transcriptional ArsR family regulator